MRKNVGQGPSSLPVFKERRCPFPRRAVHAAVATPANVADSVVLADLLHGKETRVSGDQAYRGQRAVIRWHAPKARDFTNRRYRHRGVVGEVERAEKPYQIDVAGQGRAFDRRHQAGVWLCQGALSRVDEERSSPARELRARQSIHGAPASIALPASVECPHQASKPRRQPTRQQKGRHPSFAEDASTPHSLACPCSDFP